MNGRQLLDEEMYAAAAQAGFGCPQGVWGAAIGYSMAWTSRARTSWVLSLLELRPEDHVLEIGCGPGAAIRQVAGAAPGGFVAGIDPSEVMVRQAERRNRRAIREGRVEIKLATMSAIPYPEGRFDKVFGVNAIQFSRDLPSDLKEIRRILRNGGLATFSVQPMWKGGSDAKAEEIGNDLRGAMIEAGFRECRVERKRMWPRMTVCAAGRS